MTTLDQKLASLPVERRERIEAGTRALIEEERALRSLRKARHLTQKSLATIMKTDQARISKIENSSDLLLSTLSSYVEAMGGSLTLTARFPDGSVQFADLSVALDFKSAARADFVEKVKNKRRAPRLKPKHLSPSV